MLMRRDDEVDDECGHMDVQVEAQWAAAMTGAGAALGAVSDTLAWEKGCFMFTQDKKKIGWNLHRTIGKHSAAVNFMSMEERGVNDVGV
jgi:hypothetical protein